MLIGYEKSTFAEVARIANATNRPRRNSLRFNSKERFLLLVGAPHTESIRAAAQVRFSHEETGGFDFYAAQLQQELKKVCTASKSICFIPGCPTCLYDHSLRAMWSSEHSVRQQPVLNWFTRFCGSRGRVYASCFLRAATRYTCSTL